MGENIVSLKEIANILNGYAFKSSEYQDKGHRVVRITNVQKGFLIDDDPKFYNSSENLKKYELKENDILISLTGNVGRVGLVTKNILPAYLNQRVGCIRIKEDLVDNNFLFHFLNNDCFENDCINNSKGIAQLNLSTEWLKDVEIKLPSLEDQKKIAKILDKADEIRTKKKQANEKFDKFLKSTFVDMFGDPVKNDKSLPIAKVGELTTLVSSGSTPLGGSSVYQDEGVLFIRSQNVLMNKFDFTDIAHISDEIYNSMARTQVQMNDVLLNITGASIGRIHRYMFKDKANVNQHVSIIRPVLDRISPVYLEYCIGNSNYQHNILRQNSGATRQAFNFEQIKGFKIPLPPIEKQNKFARIVEKVEVQKQKNEEVLKQMDNLFNSLSQKAFKGELLPIIDTTNNVVDIQTKQLLLHAKIIDRCRSHKTFGSVKMEKLVNICDMTQQLNLLPNGYTRMAAGPYDPQMRYSVEEQLKQKKWVRISKSYSGKMEYQEDSNFSEYRKLYSEVFAKESDKISSILNEFYNKTTDYCEAFSTLYMCWNDLLIEGKNPKKDEIIYEFKNHWSERKQKFSSMFLKDVLSDMINLHLEPKGYGVHSISSSYHNNENQLSLL